MHTHAQSLKGKIIDFRLRPPTGAYRLFFSEMLVRRSCGLLKQEVPSSYLTSLEGKPDSDDKGLDLLLAEMDRAGVRLGLMNGRHSPNRAVPVHIRDTDLRDLQRKTNDRLVGLAGVDFDMPLDEIVAGIDHAVKELGMKGVCIEPGFARKPMHAEDERIMPIYQKVADLNVPLMFMSGPLSGPDNSYTDPVHFERVARLFPKMPIVLGHAAYPYVTESIALAFKSEVANLMNVYLSPDLYAFLPGGSAYIEAVNYLPGRMVFGSAYSFASVEASVERTLSLGIDEDALHKYMYQNAERLLGL
jgi:predicted TIM-barrel fold metal-dependent hydrolase